MKELRVKKVLAITAGLFVIVYPLIVLLTLENWGARFLMFVLLGLIVFRMVFTNGYRDPKQLAVLVIVVIFALTVMSLNSDYLLKFYPVLMSCMVACLFGFSLWQNEPLVEQAARLMGKTINEEAKIYTRNLTKIWLVLILANAAFAAYTACCMGLDFWALYNGLLSYLVFIGFFALEMLYRKFYLKHDKPEGTP